MFFSWRYIINIWFKTLETKSVNKIQFLMKNQKWEEKSLQHIWLNAVPFLCCLSGCWRKVVWRPAGFHPETKNDPLFTLQTLRTHPCRRDTDLSHHKDILREREKGSEKQEECDGKNISLAFSCFLFILSHYYVLSASYLSLYLTLSGVEDGMSHFCGCDGR